MNDVGCAMTAFATDQLTRAPLDMAARGERTHCLDPTSYRLWLSEHDTERATAVCSVTTAPCSPCAVTQPRSAGRPGVHGVALIVQSDPARRKPHELARKTPRESRHPQPLSVPSWLH